MKHYNVSLQWTWQSTQLYIKYEVVRQLLRNQHQNYFCWIYCYNGDIFCCIHEFFTRSWLIKVGQMLPIAIACSKVYIPSSGLLFALLNLTGRTQDSNTLHLSRLVTVRSKIVERSWQWIVWLLSLMSGQNWASDREVANQNQRILKT